jgi:hypothetical protein
MNRPKPAREAGIASTIEIVGRYEKVFRQARIVERDVFRDRGLPGDRAFRLPSDHVITEG